MSTSLEIALAEREIRRRKQIANPPSLKAMVEATSAITCEPWQDILCARLEALTHQTGQRLLVHGPPQFGKSIIISQRFPAYLIGRNATHRVRLACYNVSHAERFSKTILSVMRDASYHALFPDPACRVPDVCPQEEWSTRGREQVRDSNPSFKALGIASGLVGLAADTLLVDDPYPGGPEARSVAINANIWSWWTETVVSRLRPESNVVVMFHRWWEGDFAGRLMEQGGWECMRFPAIADENPEGDDPTGRAPGDLLSPRYPMAYLENVRQIQGTNFEALYQGVPFPASGSMFRKEPIPLEELIVTKTPPPGGERVRRWDIASTEGAGDYTVGVLMRRLAQGKYIIEDVQRGQWGTDKRDARMLTVAREDAARGNVTQLVPQDPAASGKHMALAHVRMFEGFPVAVQAEGGERGDKEVKADPLASQWNAGNILLLKGDWNEAFIEELARFPKGKHDDQVDAAAGAFTYLAGGRQAKTVAPRHLEQTSRWHSFKGIDYDPTGDERTTQEKTTVV